MMKIIVVAENRCLGNNKASKSLNIEEPIVLMKADSTLLKDGKPFFIPDFTKHCSAGLHLVAHICRLGKSIPKRFAYRYYDSLSVGLDVRADDVVEQLSQAGLPWDAGVNFDGGAILGHFSEDAESLSGIHHMVLRVDGATIATCSTENLHWGIDELIESLSRNNMLRQGDLLYCGEMCERLALQVGQRIQVELDGTSLLDFHVR